MDELIIAIIDELHRLKDNPEALNIFKASVQMVASEESQEPLLLMHHQGCL